MRTLQSELHDATASYHSKLLALTYARAIGYTEDEVLMLSLHAEDAMHRVINARGAYARTVDVREVMTAFERFAESQVMETRLAA